MTLTFVLRLADSTPPGHIVGRVEAVASGESEVVHGVDALESFILERIERARARRAVTSHPNTHSEHSS